MPKIKIDKESKPLATATGLTPELIKGVSELSGMDLRNVTIHRNSTKTAQLRAHAFAKGSKIHFTAVQQHHLPHESWHVAPQNNPVKHGVARARQAFIQKKKKS